MTDRFITVPDSLELPAAVKVGVDRLHDSTVAGRALLTGADAAAQRASLGLGTAAIASVGDFATAEQGAKASASDVATITLTAPLALTVPAGFPAGQVYRVTLTQDGTGGHTVTYDDVPLTINTSAGASTLVEIWPSGAVVYPGATGGSAGLDTEAVQDVVGAMVTAAGGTYNDDEGTITLPGPLHGTSHEIGGFDPITPEGIGAAPLAYVADAVAVANDARVTLHNRVPIGDMSAGVSGWATYQATVAADAGSLLLTATGAGVYGSMNNTSQIVSVVGHVYYVRADVRPNVSACTNLVLRTGATNVSIGPLAADQWHSVSANVTAVSADAYTILYCYYGSSAAAAGKTVNIDNVLCVDLTEAFGAGREPLSAQMDAIYASEGWFADTIKITALPSQWIGEINPSGVLLPDGRSLDDALYSAPNAPLVTLAPVTYAVVGKEVNIYFDAIMKDYQRYDINVVCAVGKQQSHRWTHVPTVAGAYTLTVELYREDALLHTQSTQLSVSAAETGAGTSKSLIVIGDSTIDYGVVSGELVALFGASDPMDLVLMGSRGTAPALHEGRSGWTAYNYTHLASTGGVSNAFWNGTAFDFSAYKTAKGYSTVDYVIINLGINDVFSVETDSALFTKQLEVLGYYDTMIASIRAAGTVVGVAVPIPPAATQEAFGANYAAGQTQWRYKRNILGFADALIQRYKNRAAEGIYLVPINAGIDTTNNYPVETVAISARNAATIVRQANGVHPDATGYYQVADQIYSWLKRA